MKVGSFVLATEQGLGRLAKDFYDEGIITDPFIIPHSSRSTNKSWFPNAPTVNFRDDKEMEKYIKTVDKLLIFETPFNWNVIPICRKHNVKTFLVPMYECMPVKMPYEPDYYLCPSKLDSNYYTGYNCRYVPIPVSEEIRKGYRLRSKESKVFVHNAGNLGLNNRNGTGELIDAIPMIKSSITLIIRAIKRLPWGIPESDNIKVDLRIGVANYAELYQEGDVFVFPEKFNGLSLPLQEARASGMTVCATDRFPNNTYLPREVLITPSGKTKTRLGGHLNEFDSAVVSPIAIAETIDKIASGVINTNFLSYQAAEYNFQMSWKNLKPQWMEILEKGF